jgi:hypothetical protein
LSSTINNRMRSASSIDRKSGLELRSDGIGTELWFFVWRVFFTRTGGHFARKGSSHEPSQITKQERNLRKAATGVRLM